MTLLRRSGYAGLARFCHEWTRINTDFNQTRINTRLTLHIFRQDNLPSQRPPPSHKASDFVPIHYIGTTPDKMADKRWEIEKILKNLQKKCNESAN